MPTHYDGTDAQKRALDLYIKLIRASDSVAARALVCVHDAQITPSQFGVLEALLHLGPLTLSELAAKHLKSPNNLTVVVDNLERAELVKRVRCGSDRRVVYVHLTETGRERVTQILPAHVDAIAAQMAVLTDDEMATLSELLRRLGRQIPQSDAAPEPK